MSAPLNALETLPRADPAKAQASNVRPPSLPIEVCQAPPGPLSLPGGAAFFQPSRLE